MIILHNGIPVDQAKHSPEGWDQAQVGRRVGLQIKGQNPGTTAHIHAFARIQEAGVPESDGRFGFGEPDPVDPAIESGATWQVER